MNSEQIDLFVEESGSEIHIRIVGVFGFTQMAPLREKVMGLLDGPGKLWFLDVRQARFTIQEYLSMFLDFLSKAKGNGANLVLVFDDEAHREFFSPYIHLFTIVPDLKSYRKKGLLKALRKAGVSYSRQTGIRMSPLIALLFILILLGWFLAFYGIIREQGEEIREKEAYLMEMNQDAERMQSELDYLESILGPLKNLGLVIDSTTSKKSKARIRNWTKYLERLEDSRREK